jgi:hypothetical protein
MDSIDLYVREVGRNLPPKMRTDIEQEIRSLIEDTLEDENTAQGRPQDEELVMTVLQRLGPPEKMAASYLPPRYLIGPELFPHYLSVLRILAPAVTMLAALGLGLSIGAKVQETGSLITAIVQAFVGLIDALFQMVAWVTVVFAIIQWAAPSLKLPEKQWDPRKLKAEPDPERVSTSEKVGEIAGLVFGLILFNLYPQWIGVSFIQNGQWVHLPVLSQAFSLYIPWLSLIWLVEIVRDTWVVARGRWSTLLRWFTIVISLGSIAVTAWIFTGPAIITVTPNTFIRLGWGLSGVDANQTINGINMAVHLGVGVALVVGIFELGKQIYQLVLRDRLPVQIPQKG